MSDESLQGTNPQQSGPSIALTTTVKVKFEISDPQTAREPMWIILNNQTHDRLWMGLSDVSEWLGEESAMQMWGDLVESAGASGSAHCPSAAMMGQPSLLRYQYTAPPWSLVTQATTVAGPLCSLPTQHPQTPNFNCWSPISSLRTLLSAKWIPSLPFCSWISLCPTNSASVTALFQVWVP